MRALTGLFLLGAAFAAAPSAALAADTPPMCDFTSGGDYSYQQRLGPFLSAVASSATPGAPPTVSGGQAGDAARTVLGAQYVMLWADTQRQGWAVAFSPGTHDATTARVAIDAYLASRVSAADKDYLMGALTLLPTPYSLAELTAVQDALYPLGAIPAFASGGGITCQHSDGVRVEVGIADPETPELRAQAEAWVAPYGDKVRLRFGVGRAVPAIGSTPIPTAPLETAKPALRLRDHVALPATTRCVRGGTLTVKAAGQQVRKLRLAAGARAAFGKPGKPAKLKLKARRTKVAVTVTLKDGRTATQTVTYRRCS